MDTLTAESVMTLKVSELKAQLTARGLQANGIKSALQKRLVEALQTSGAGDAMDADEPAAEDKIDESTRYSGTVQFFKARQGFGTIVPDGKDAANKKDHIFVHWKQIRSNDDWPSLKKGQKVEYYLGEKAKPRKASQKIFAAAVTLEGGNLVTNADERVFPNKGQRFQGTVSQFFFKKGFGFINPKESFNFDEQDFHADKKGEGIYFGKESLKVSYDDRGPSVRREAEVEFTIYKTTNDKGETKYAAGEITKVGGQALGDDEALPKLSLEDRKEHRKKMQKKRKAQAKKRKAKEMAASIKPISKKMMKQLQKQQMAMMMGGMNPMMMGGGMMNPMMAMMGGMQPQMVTLGGQKFMMMPNMMQAGGKKKKRRKNKKKAGKN